MELNRFGKGFRKLVNFSLTFLLITFFLGLNLNVQPASAATWGTVNPGFGTTYPYTIAYGNGTWLLFSQGGGIGKSADGTTFIQHPNKPLFPCLVNDAMHFETQWIAACHNGKIYTLADGLDPVDVTNWVERTTGKSNRLVSIATDGTMIVVVGPTSGTLLISIDGHNWDDHSISGVMGFNAVTYGQGKFLAVGKATDNSNVIYASSDNGETWNKVATATPNNSLYGISYGGGKFVAAGLAGYLYVSNDGTIWEQKLPPSGTQSINFATVSYEIDQFYVGGTSETILTSSDGSTFTTEITGGGTKSVNSITATNGKAIAAGSSGLLLSTASAPPLSSNASLSSLLVTPTPNSVTSNPTTNTYTVEVPYGTPSVTVTPILQDTTATIKVNGTSTSDGKATSVTLDTDGSTDITIVVTAQDGITTKTYLITVNEATPSDGYLSSLSIGGIPVSGFVKTNFDYNIEVPHGTGNVHVKWTLDGFSTLHAVRVDGIEQMLGSPPISGISWFLTPGIARVFEIDVKAQNGNTTTYTLTVKEEEALVNKADLQAKVTEITNENLVEAEYTSASWQELQNKLTAARSVLNNPNATQQDVDNANIALELARNGLVFSTDKSLLQARMNTMNSLNKVDYTPASWNALISAKQAAEAVLNNLNATQTQVDQALATLTAAFNQLVPVAQQPSGLQTLIPSSGSLSPAFSSSTYAYSMNVGYGITQIDFTTTAHNANATVSLSVNGQSVTKGQVPLVIGANTVVITVQDATGTKEYRITVTRAHASSGSGGTIPEQPKTEKIVVDLEIDGDNPLSKIPIVIERTKNANGQITDYTVLTPESAQQAIQRAKESNNHVIRIVLPDSKDEVDKATITIPKRSTQLLRDNEMTLEISTNGAHIAIPFSSMIGVEDDYNFYFIPLKTSRERQLIEERARTEKVVREALKRDDISIVGRPMTIETNLPSRPVVVTLPLTNVTLPTDKAEREAYVKRLGVFIEHTDGDKVVIFPDIVTLKNGGLGLRFTVDKFSTFTIIDFGEQEMTEHLPYIKGFEDGTFKPGQAVTRNQVALMLARILGHDSNKPITASAFGDLPAHHPSASAAAYLKELGIMNGDQQGNFNGSQYITRAEMAVVIANYKELDVVSTPLTFTDTSNHWARYYIEANRKDYIISGYADGSFKPQDHLTRAQAVKMINRMFDRGPLHGMTKSIFSDVPTSYWAFEDIVEASIEHTYTVDENQLEWIVQ